MRYAQNDANSEEAFEIAEFTGLVYSCEPATGDRAASSASSEWIVDYSSLCLSFAFPVLAPAKARRVGGNWRV
jgi:hypothetical protein